MVLPFSVSRGGGRYVIDRGVRKAVKTCAYCNRDFTWRKKWERNWDEVKYCSKRCRSSSRAFGLTSNTESHQIALETQQLTPPNLTRKERKRLAKQNRRDRRAGNFDNRKECQVCAKRVDTTIRCTIDASQEWTHVCGKCWHDVSGGVTDGDARHPHYRYGGLWRNRK